MKKILSMAIIALFAVSCKTVNKTATNLPVSTPITAIVTAELEVSPDRIEFTYFPPAEIKRGGLNNVKAAAIAEALKVAGNADVLVEPQTVIETKGLFRKIQSIKVSGYPATYIKFNSVKNEDISKIFINHGGINNTKEE